MYATDFQFDDQLASSYGLVICTFGSAGDVESVRNGADVTLTTSRVPNSNVWNHVNAQYNEVLSVTFQVAKKRCGKDAYINPYFTMQEQRAINRWLNRLDKYYPFRIVQDGFDKIYFNAQINVNKIELNGHVAGFEITVTTDKPYGYFEKQQLNFQLAQNGTIKFIDLSDDIGSVDVQLKLTCLDDGDLTLTNHLTKQSMVIKNCVSGEVIKLDSGLRKISSNTREQAQMLANGNFNFVWFNIGNTKTEKINRITSTLPVKVELVYYPTCKISF